MPQLPVWTRKSLFFTVLFVLLLFLLSPGEPSALRIRCSTASPVWRTGGATYISAANLP